MHPLSIIAKLWRSLIYSLSGLAYITKTELSFQLELAYFAVSLIALYFLPLPLMESIIIVSTIVLLLVTEIFNTVIELIADRISPEKSAFAEHSKDLGSTAVFLVLIISLIQWVLFLWPLLR